MIDLDRVGEAGVFAAYAEMALLRAFSELCAAYLVMYGARGSRQKFALKILAEIPVSGLSVFHCKMAIKTGFEKTIVFFFSSVIDPSVR
jgi:hypothetical protein